MVEGAQYCSLPHLSYVCVASDASTKYLQGSTQGTYKYVPDCRRSWPTSEALCHVTTQKALSPYQASPPPSVLHVYMTALIPSLGFMGHWDIQIARCFRGLRRKHERERNERGYDKPISVMGILHQARLFNASLLHPAASSRCSGLCPLGLENSLQHSCSLFLSRGL